MRKHLGKLGKVYVGLFPHTATPFLLLCAAFFLIPPTICHAQNEIATCVPPNYLSVAPTDWEANFSTDIPNIAVPGQSYTVHIYGEYPIYPGNWQTPSYPSCPDVIISAWKTGINTSGVEMLAKPAPYIGLSNLTYVSPTLTTFTMSISKDAPLGISGLLLTTGTSKIANGNIAAVNWENPWEMQVIISIPPPVCPTPTITAVTPNIWFAGKTYNQVTLTGSGFTNTTACPAPPVNITDANDNSIPYSSVSVVSATKMVVTAVAPFANNPTETACVTLGYEYTGPMVVRASAAAKAAPAPGTAGSPCYDYYGFNGITAQILGNQIQCDPSMLNCGGTTISVIDGTGSIPTTQAVVGQQIILNSLPLPNGINATKTAWAVGGTKIAGYNPTTGPTNVTTFQDSSLNSPNINFYWIKQNDSIPVTYEYCVNIPGVGN